MTSPPSRSSYREVFADPIFRVLFLTRSVAIAADTLRILALSVIVFTTTGSALLTAITFGIGFLPQVVGGTLLGSLADRLAPRRLIASGTCSSARSRRCWDSSRCPSRRASAWSRSWRC